MWTLFSKRILKLCNFQKNHYSSATSTKGTLSQQDNLLRLPLPELTVTINKWLETTKPHLTENEFAKTKFLAENFVNEAEPFQVPKIF